MLKRQNKILFGTLILCVVVSGSTLIFKQRSYAEWIEKEQGRQYENENGELVTGFFEINKNRYYFDKEGYLAIGKFYCEEDNSYYYADKNGIIKKDIIKTKKGFYIADSGGKIQTGFVEYKGERYFFDGAANQVYGWFKSEDKWYYANEKGVVQTGFLTLDGYRYYLQEDGSRVSDAVMEIDGTTYVFNSDGSVDENATAMYQVYLHLISIQHEHGNDKGLLLNSKVQACSMMRATDLANGFVATQDAATVMETLLKNRGIRCKGGCEFAYGGVDGYDMDRLIADLDKDDRLVDALLDTALNEVGLAVYEKEGIFYYDIILVSTQ